MKHSIVLFLSAVAALSACNPSYDSSLEWPEQTGQMRPWTRWWWPGSAVSESDITAMLDSYAEAGLGGMEVTTIYGAKGYEDSYREYLSDEWMDLFCFTLGQARLRGLGVDLANASGWPFGGPWVNPDEACRYLATRTFYIKGGESLDGKVEYVEEPMVQTLGRHASIEDLEYPITANDSLQQYAFEQVRYPLSLPLLSLTAYGPDGAYLDLTGRVGVDRTLDWIAPEGDWTLCALFLGWHGKMVERAGPGGEGDVIDHFSGEAITKYLSRFDEAFKGRDVSYIRYYFNDSYEVDDARGDSDWTPEFFDEFEARRGYDLRPHMLELLGLSEDIETSDRVVFDYRTTIGELLLEKYSTIWQEWAAAQGKGIRNQAHGSPANILDLYAVSDVPETEGRSIIGMKTASSAAHVTDKPLTSSESCTWLDEHFRSNLGDVRNSLDTYFLSGVNHIFYHGTCMSPEDAQWPGWLFYAAVHFQPTNSFWTDFAAVNSYVTRCQSFLQAGRPDNDILLFFDSADLLSKRGREKMLFHMNQLTPEQSAIGLDATALYDKGYTWDYITDKMLSERVGARRGKIVTSGGTEYSCIIVPECTKMLPETFSKLLELAKGGATVIFKGSLPGDVPGLFEIEARRADLTSMSQKLSFKAAEGCSEASHGRGRVLLGDNLEAMLARAGVTRERMYDSGMQCISRVKPDGGRYYFIKNNSGQSFAGRVPLDCECESVALFNPWDGRIGYGSLGEDGVYLQLRAGETMLLETFTEARVGESYEFYTPARESVAVTGEWDMTFVKGGPDIPAGVHSGLGSWTEYGPEYERFCGTVEYAVDIPAMPGAEGMWILDLGDVRNSAAVSLNGEILGTVVEAPYAVMVPGERLQAGGRLVVSVSGSMENRIAWMDREGVVWKNLYNANIQARLSMDRGADGYFTAALWETVPQGLLGPVTLTPLEAVTE